MAIKLGEVSRLRLSYINIVRFDYRRLAHPPESSGHPWQVQGAAPSQQASVRAVPGEHRVKRGIQNLVNIAFRLLNGLRTSHLPSRRCTQSRETSTLIWHSCRRPKWCRSATSASDSSTGIRSCHGETLRPSPRFSDNSTWISWSVVTLTRIKSCNMTESTSSTLARPPAHTHRPIVHPVHRLF